MRARAHDAGLREQPRAGGEDGGAPQRARRRRARAALSRVAVARAPAPLEQSLKAGRLRALVSTSSLELGIDIGSVDLVLQLQSPKRVANGLQRVGRAGHSLDAVSRGVFVPTFRDDAMELLAVVGAMLDGDVEPTRVVQNALDVLAQVARRGRRDRRRLDERDTVRSRAARVSVSPAHARGVRRSARDARRASIRPTSPPSSTRG